MGFKKIDQILQCQNYVTDRQIKTEFHPILAWLFLFMLKRDANWEYQYVYMDDDGFKAKWDWKYEIPKHFRPLVECRFSRVR